MAAIKRVNGSRFFGQHKIRNIFLVALLAAIAFIVISVILSANGSLITIDKNVKSACMTEVKDNKFCIFAAHISKSDAYQATLSTSSDTSVPASAVIQGSKDGNIQEVDSSNGQETDTIVVFNGTIYAKRPGDSGWMQYASSAADKPQVFNMQTDIFKSNSFKGSNGQKLNYAYVGDEACGNSNCHKYQITDTTNTTNQATIWFGSLDFQLHQFNAKIGDTNLQLVVNYQPVNIIQPVPVTSIVK